MYPGLHDREEVDRMRPSLSLHQCYPDYHHCCCKSTWFSIVDRKGWWSWSWCCCTVDVWFMIHTVNELCLSCALTLKQFIESTLTPQQLFIQYKTEWAQCRTFPPTNLPLPTLSLWGPVSVLFCAACPPHVRLRGQCRADILGPLCKFPEKSIKRRFSRNKVCWLQSACAEIFILDKIQSLVICSLSPPTA